VQNKTRDMSRLIIIFLTFILLQSCNTQLVTNRIDEYLDDSIKVDTLNIPIYANQSYFPLKVFTDTSIYIGHDTFIVKWYSKHLSAMKEPLMFNKTQNKIIYRFLWLRTFNNPVAIRIEKQLDTYNLTWKLCDGAGGYDPGKLVVNKTKSIDKETWGNFITLLNKSGFWNLNTNEVDIQCEDGAQWILEGVDRRRYHVVDRNTPLGGSFYDCCDFLIGLTDLK